MSCDQLCLFDSTLEARDPCARLAGWLACEHACLPVGSLSTIESCVGLNAVNISVGEDLIIVEWALQKLSIFAALKTCITLDGAY